MEPLPSEQARASAVGNSFHIPSLALVLLVLFSSACQATAVPTSRLAYSADEQYLRLATANTVWQPGVVEASPFLLKPAQVVDQIFSVFGEAEIHLSDKAGMIKCLSIPSFTAIQCYRVDACMRDPHCTYFGPDRRVQCSPGQAAAALQHQRGGPKSRFAIGALLPSGLSKEEHELASRALVFPFSRPALLDDDLDFAARATAALGPFFDIWRHKQTKALATLARRLLPWEAQARAAMCKEVHQVAGNKAPVFITFQSATLEWPDATVGVRYVTGHRIVGAGFMVAVFLSNIHCQPWRGNLG